MSNSNYQYFITQDSANESCQVWTFDPKNPSLNQGTATHGVTILDLWHSRPRL